MALAQPNQKIGPYTLIRKIGHGGFGIVWLAEKRTAIGATRFALKLARDDEIDTVTFEEEAAIWIRASGHPNVLPIIEAEIYDGQAVIVTEYAPDGSLREWLKKHGGSAPSPEAAVAMTLQILAGLEHLHKQRIIHRDIKPDNILLQYSSPRLADFGIARVLKTDTHSKGVIGTLAYMAPECFDGKRSQQTDVWSVGVVLYEMLAGHLPYDQADTASLINAIVSRDPPALSESIPQSLCRIVAGALSRDPTTRYQSAAEMRQAVQLASHESSQEQPALTARSPYVIDQTLKVDQRVFQARPLSTPNRVIRSSKQKIVTISVTVALALGGILVLIIWQRFPNLLNDGGQASRSSAYRNLRAIEIQSSVHDFGLANTLAVRDKPESYELLGKTVIVTDCIVSAVAFSPDSKNLASGTWCGQGIKIWDTQTGQLNRKISSTGDWSSIAFSPNGASLAAADTGNNVVLWNLKTGSLTQTLTTPRKGQPSMIAFSPDGNQLAVGSADKTVTLFRLSTGQVEKNLDCGYEVSSLAFSPNGKTLATGSNGQYGVSFWDVETGVLKRNLTEAGGAVAFSPDGATLASGSGANIKLWDSNTGALRRTFTYNGSYLHSIAFSPDGKTLAASGGYWEVAVWDVQSGTLRQRLSGHKDWVRAVAFSPDGKFLASGSGDGTIKLWK